MLISICVPIYNTSSYIERCARSIFEQTYQNIECIFVDDKSTDNSLSILRNVLSQYPERKHQVRFICHEKNLGLAAVRNTAVATASGEFIMHVDSDDWIELDAVEQLVNKQLESGADIVSGNALAHFYSGEKIYEEPDFETKDDMMVHMAKLTMDHVIWRRIIRTSLYKDNNIRAVEGLDFGEDHYTLPRLIYYADSYAKIDRIIYHYNCTNETSYMRAKGLAAFMKRKQGNIDAIDVLLDFFTNRSERCEDTLLLTKSSCLIEFMGYCVKSRDYRKYSYFSKILYHMDERYLNFACSYSWKIKLINRFYVLHLIYSWLKFIRF